MIRVVLCDDQDVVREGLAAILGATPGIQVVGVAENGPAAVELAAMLQPDLVLMDLN
ncbi:MAG: response regulator, partial [Anaerolineae bacterium]|nr:response regulator [Anaerolineae bacterium]